jgi:VWFA-related protein
MNPRFQFAQQAAAAFVRKMVHTGDTVSLWTIGPTPSRKVARTDDIDALMSALMGLPGTDGTTALFDTAVAAAADLKRPSQPGSLRVLILLSDGEDNNSSDHGLIGAVNALQRTDCVLYAINSAGTSSNINETGRRGIGALEALASGTGGLVFAPEQPQDLPAVFGRIAADLEAQYLLEYYASNVSSDGAFHQIQVLVPGRLGLRVRSRRGYWSR